MDTPVDEADAREAPALRALVRRRSLCLALAPLRGYNRRLLFIPGAFLFLRAVLRNRRTSSVRSGASLCSGLHGDVVGRPWCHSPRPATPLRARPSGSGAPAARALGAAGSGLTMDAITQVLNAIEQGDPHAAEQLLPLVYEELRKLATERMAQEKPGQTLQATALVHEAYLRLVDVDREQRWNSRGHFFAAAAEAMRRILVEYARRKRRQKRGGDRQRVGLDEVQITVEGPSKDLVALDEALSKLAQEHPEKAELVKLRYFAGLTLREAAQVLGISRSTADRHWTYARAWLYREGAPEEEA